MFSFYFIFAFCTVSCNAMFTFLFSIVLTEQHALVDLRCCLYEWDGALAGLLLLSSLNAVVADIGSLNNALGH